MPPLRVYIAKATHCTAGENPVPAAASTLKSVKAKGVDNNAMNKYAMTSTKSEAWARPRSKAGEWISFRTVRVGALLESPGVSDEAGVRRGCVSVDSAGICISMMVGFGLRTLIATGNKQLIASLVAKWLSRAVLTRKYDGQEYCANGAYET